MDVIYDSHGQLSCHNSPGFISSSDLTCRHQLPQAVVISGGLFLLIQPSMVIFCGPFLSIAGHGYFLVDLLVIH